MRRDQRLLLQQCIKAERFI